jgi:phosphatidylethanolamine/phosphatidyl-N-methylethanolamine N-methyltransferase
MARFTAPSGASIESRRVEKVYSVLSRVYDTAFDWALGPGRRRAVGKLPIQPGDRILEVGVGTGLSFPHYPVDCRITGIDIAEAMLQQAVERAASLQREDISLRLMDAHDMSLPDDYFDHVLAPYVISVVPDPEGVMSEILRVCKPGGTIIVVNHFISQNRLLRFFETILTPLTQWIGFRMDLPIDRVKQTPHLTCLAEERVNLAGLWHLLVMRKED